MKTMKPFLSALLLSGIVIFSSCKKDDEPVDPRNALVGTYDVEFGCAPNAGEVELEIKKDPSDAKKIIITSEVFDELGVGDIEAAVESGGFELEDTEFDFVDPEDGERYTGEISGDGEVNGKELEIDFTLNEDRGIRIPCNIEGEKQ